ncbi:MAG: aromatic amino acid transport family protein [Parachlamydiales bacterium]|jgi:tyrosine-specific transport protein
MHNWAKFLGGILLVAGTTIGAAMLALPVSAGVAGFIPSLVLFICFWLYMTYTALLFLEVNTWSGQRTNLLTMAKMTLGRPGEAISWTAYLFLLYSLLTAYIAGSSAIISDLLTSTFNIPPLGAWCGIPLVLLLAYLLLRGTAHVDYWNRFLMIGLAVSYSAMLIMLSPYVETEKLIRSDWPTAFSVVSVVATAYGFHIIIPSLYSYMHGDIKILKWTLLIGSFIPLVIYALWQMIALGIIPFEGANGLLQGYQKGANGATLLANAINTPVLSLIAQLFSFFAIVTSFIGVALALCDFLADGFKLQRTHTNNLMLVCLVFIPPFLIAITYARAFLTALEISGAYGVVFLLGLMPALMVWRGRYIQKRFEGYAAPGGKITLIAAMLFSFLVIGLEIAKSLSLL